MKAISPALPLRRNHLVSYSQDLGISPVKSVWDEPLGVLCEMNGCYSRLKELVPSLPQDRSVSNMEILQHVIDYILDLQLALDSSSTDPSPPPQRHPRSGSPGSPDTSSSSTDDTSSFSPLSNFSRVTTTDEHPRISR